MRVIVAKTRILSTGRRAIRGTTGTTLPVNLATLPPSGVVVWVPDRSTVPYLVPVSLLRKLTWWRRALLWGGWYR